MRVNHISPEFNYTTVFGTLSMKEESSFFGSKMLEIQDVLSLENQSLIYYENNNGEQLNLDIEKSIGSIVYSASDDKKANHSLVFDDSQSEEIKKSKTKYILTINLERILTNFIFGLLKQYRTFEGVKASMCYSNNVSESMREYIRENVLNRYRYSKLDFYINYLDIKGQDLRRYANNWNPNLNTGKFTNYIKQTDFNNTYLKLFFNQELSSQDSAFEYNFNIYWEKL